jgi:hypothetical protein
MAGAGLLSFSSWNGSKFPANDGLAVRVLPGVSGFESEFLARVEGSNPRLGPFV